MLATALAPTARIISNREFSLIYTLKVQGAWSGGCKRPVEMGGAVFVVVALTPYGGWHKEAKEWTDRVAHTGDKVPHDAWDERFEHPARTWASASHRAFTLQATGVAMANATYILSITVFRHHSCNRTASNTTYTTHTHITHYNTHTHTTLPAGDARCTAPRVAPHAAPCANPIHTWGLCWGRAAATHCCGPATASAPYLTGHRPSLRCLSLPRQRLLTETTGVGGRHPPCQRRRGMTHSKTPLQQY